MQMELHNTCPNALLAYEGLSLVIGDMG
jgi:hypothetical protein